MATDPEIDREFYRLAGFRFLGKRAVRIDILERLADLIRPALQWNPGAASARPEAAYDGRRFITTTGMLSILGATQDDIEEILKGLGYRADAVPAEEAQTHIAALDAAQAEIAGPTASGPVVEVVVSRTAADRPHKPVAVAGDAPADETGAVTETSAEVAPAVASEVAETPASSDEAKTDDGPLNSASEQAQAPAADASPAAEEPKADAGTEPETAVAEETEAPRPVLLWRPGGRQDAQRGPRNAPGEGRGRREGGNRTARTGDKPGSEGGAEGEGRPNKGHRGKPAHHGKGGQGKGGPGRGTQDKGGAGKGGGRNERPVRREKPIDPDSPFAALAALRDKLKK